MLVEQHLPLVELRFFQAHGHTWYLLEPFNEQLYLADSLVEIPLLDVKRLTLGKNGITVGYRLRLPRSSVIQPTHVVIGKTKDDYIEPHIGLPGLQIFSGDTSVCLVSTKITDFYHKLGASSI